MMVSEYEEIGDVMSLVKEGKLKELKELFYTHSEKLEELLHTRDWSGDDMLAIACWHGHFEVAEWLINDMHMNVNDTNKSGATPLHRACHQENLDIIRLLCNHGADLYAKDCSGRTPKDVGNNIVRRFIQERIDVQVALYEIKLAELAELDHEWECQIREEAEAQYFQKIQSRCLEAQAVVITGARVDVVKGSYLPIPEAIHCDWPVYLRKDLHDMVLLYHMREPDDYAEDNTYSGHWLIFHRADMFPEELEKSIITTSRRQCYDKIMDPTMCYVQMKSDPPDYPELRVEGHNGIIEYDIVNGMFIELSSEDCVLEVLSEGFVEALKATAKLKAGMEVYQMKDIHLVSAEETS